MNRIKNIEDICNRFMQGEFSIKEFQSRLNTLSFEGFNKNGIPEILLEADNRLEEIIYCDLESNYYSNGIKVAECILDMLRKL